MGARGHVALLLLVPSSAQALNVELSHFGNGLQVVVIADRRTPVVTHMGWYLVGSADEPAGKAGIAHFLEHLLFKGTETLSPGEFSNIVYRHGGEDDAFTSRDYTAYTSRSAGIGSRSSWRLRPTGWSISF